MGEKSKDNKKRDELDILDVTTAKSIKKLSKFGMVISAILEGGFMAWILSHWDDFKAYYEYKSGELQLTEREINTLMCNNKILMYGGVGVSTAAIALFCMCYKYYKEGKEAENRLVKE